MKKIYFLTVSIFFVCKLVGQTYHPLIRSTISWDVMFRFAENLCNYNRGYRYHFEGDTTISGKTYNLITANPIVSVSTVPPNSLAYYCPPYAADENKKLDAFSGYYSALLREDSLQRKVFIYEPNYGELLLYDFNLKAGDTLRSSAEGGLHAFAVDSVKLVTLLNGEVRKKFYLKYMPGYPETYYIEGVGGSQGLQFHLDNPGFGFGGGHDPTCITENKLPLWGSTCIGTVGVPKYHNDQLINVFPNPAKDVLYIENKNSESSLICILDLSGRILLSKKLISSKEEMDITSLPAGAYMYIIEKGNQRNNGKFVVVR